MIPSFLRFCILRSCCFARCFPAAGEVPPTAPRAAYEKRATEIHPLLLCNSPPATQVVSQSIALIGSGVNCFLPHCGPFCMPAIRCWRWGRRPPGPLPGQQEPRFRRKRRHFQRPAPEPLPWRTPPRRFWLLPRQRAWPPALPRAPWRGRRPPPAAFWCGA